MEGRKRAPIVDSVALARRSEVCQSMREWGRDRGRGREGWKEKKQDGGNKRETE